MSGLVEEESALVVVESGRVVVEESGLEVEGSELVVEEEIGLEGVGNVQSVVIEREEGAGQYSPPVLVYEHFLVLVQGLSAVVVV